MSRRPLTAAVAGACLLGMTGMLFRIADVSPATGGAWRCLLALPFLLGLAAYENRRVPARRRERRVALAAGAVLALDLLVWHRCVEAVGAGLGTVLGNSQVIFAVLAAAVLFGQPISARLWAAIVALLAGVVLVSGVLDEQAYGSEPAVGIATGVLAGMLYAAFVLLLREASGGGPPSVKPVLDATIGAAVTSVAAGALLGQIDLLPPASSLVALLALALVGQVLGWVLLSLPINRLGAPVTSVVLVLQPVSAVAWGALLIDERPSALQLAGVVVTAGAFVVAYRQQAA